MSIIITPGAIDQSTETWRGLAPSKNWLGQASLAGVIVWSSAIRGTPFKKKFYSLLFLCGSIILLFDSGSITSILVFIILWLFAILLVLEKHLDHLRVGRFFTLTIMFSVVLLVFMVQFLEPYAYESLLKTLGKDSTFTGRTDLWAEIFKKANTHLFFGCGFDGFWVVGNKPLMHLYEEFVWLPNQAHFGYLDLLNEMGIVGLFLFLLIAVFYLKNLLSFGKPHFWKWFVISALLLNLQESTLFRLNAVSGVLFTFSYLALYVEILKNPTNLNIRPRQVE